MWKNYNYGATIGRKGSENGTILKDEEYNDEDYESRKKGGRK